MIDEANPQLRSSSKLVVFLTFCCTGPQVRHYTDSISDFVGTGKTSTVLALARRIYGPSYKKHILELNASDDRGIDVVRDQIKSFAATKVLFSKGFKLIILDEADMMTQAAQGALRRGEFSLYVEVKLTAVIEQHTKNVRFAILCNYVNKITPAIQSRCTRFRFSPLPEEEVAKKVDEVVEKEG